MDVSCCLLFLIVKVIPILLTETTSSCGARTRPRLMGAAATVPVGTWVPGIAAGPLQDPAGLVMVAATVVTGAVARAPRHALLAAPRAISPSVLLAAAAATAVVVALARAGPRAGAPRRVATATKVRLLVIRAVAPTSFLPVALRGQVAVPLTVVPSLAALATVKTTTRPVAALLAAPLHAAPAASRLIPEAIVAAPQVVEAATRAPVAPGGETIPDVEADEAVAVPRGPPTGTPRDVGRATEVLEVAVPRGGRGPLPVRQAVRRRVIAAPAAPAPGQVRATLIRGTVEVQAATVPRPEAASGVPCRRPIPVGVAAGPVEAPPAGEGALAAVARGAEAGVPATLVPAVVVAATTPEASGLVPGARRLGATLAVEAKADAGALRGPRGPIRAATATTGVPAASMAPTRLPRVRGVTPTAGVAVPATPSPVTEAATAA